MEIVFLNKKDLRIMPFKVEKTMTEKNWQHLLKESTTKLGDNLAIIFWDNKKIFPLKDVDYKVVRAELGFPKTQF